MALDDMTSHVSAVVALADHALVTLDGFAEGVLTAHEEEEHFFGVVGRSRVFRIVCLSGLQAHRCRRGRQ